MIKKRRLERKVEIILKNAQRKIKLDISKVVGRLNKLNRTIDAPPLVVNVTIVNDKKIASLNRMFLKKDIPTDVLSFKISPSEGEVIISAEQAKANGPDYGLSTEEEILYLIIHGILHIKGYTDYTKESRDAMFKKQDMIFDALISA